MALPKIPDAFLQVVIVVHFVLTVWANQCSWLPISYQFCNFLVLAVGVGAVIAPSDHAVAELFLVGMAFALLQDIIVVATFYNGGKYFGCKKVGHFWFSFTMAMFNIILKPVSLCLIYLNYLGRGDGGVMEKIAAYRSTQAAAREPPNEALPPRESAPPY